MAKTPIEILIATDIDREGKAIMLHISEPIGRALLLTGIYSTSTNKGDQND